MEADLGFLGGGVENCAHGGIDTMEQLVAAVQHTSVDLGTKLTASEHAPLRRSPRAC